MMGTGRLELLLKEAFNAEGSTAFETALAALGHEPQRTRAGVLCVASGMAVIVALSSIAVGGRREILKAVEAAGSSNVFLKRSAKETSRSEAGLSTAEVAGARERIPGLKAACALRIGRHTLSVGVRSAEVPVYAVTPGVFATFPLRAATGRVFSGYDFQTRSRRLVMGAGAARELSGGSGGPGGRATLDGEAYEVVGALAPLASDSGGGVDLGAVDWDRGVLVPLGSEPAPVLAPDENYPVTLAVLRFASPGDAAIGARKLQARFARDVTAGSITVTTPRQALEQFRAARRSFDGVVLLVSVLSAISAGFGIMNLLRGSVVARAGEIGLRRAVGARASDIRRQLLAEGLLLGLGGGLLGIVVGVAISVTLLARAGWRPAFEPLPLLFLTLGSAVFGVAVGLKPAIDAGRLDPAVALRIE